MLFSFDYQRLHHKSSKITVMNHLKVLILFTFVSITTGCKYDWDCPPEMYCYTSGDCASCSDCSNYRRHNNSRCVRDANDCGNCLPGYEDVDTFDGSKSTCILKENNEQKPESKIPDQKPVGFENYSIAIIVVAFVLGIIVITMFVVRRPFIKKNFRRVINYPSNTYRPECPPNAPPYEETGPPENPINYFFPDYRNPICENNNTQQANMFKPPSYVRNSAINITNDNPEEENDQGIGNDQGPLLQHLDIPMFDEETQPSNWVPYSDMNVDNPIDREEVDNRDNAVAIIPDQSVVEMTPRSYMRDTPSSVNPTTFQNILSNPLNDLVISDTSPRTEEQNETGSQEDCSDPQQDYSFSQNVNISIRNINSVNFNLNMLQNNLNVNNQND